MQGGPEEALEETIHDEVPMKRKMSSIILQIF